MLEFKERQWTMLADKLGDAANVALGALVFGQFLSESGFSLLVARSGLTAWVALLFWAALLTGRGES